ncbi:hypothetical protein [Flavobacterium caeni]|uniref:Lipoprotein n=1 Tax=Flavobacterium caeni TaxID=490189 RepID=A0A1G5KJF9_9FLAO|nr:hypothetical protein [Flavobacterium caeni]SCZ00079.1 hypothetical protein SAMN02927903_03315 [Flavobacterium caeni]
MKIQILLISSALFFTFSCNKKTDDKRTSVDKIIDVVIETSDGQSVEFPDLYNFVYYSLSDENPENLILVRKLMYRGFKINESGRGNYPPLGPRIINVNMRKEDCECNVSKIYYSTVNDSIFQTTEKISCKRTGR